MQASRRCIGYRLDPRSSDRQILLDYGLTEGEVGLCVAQPESSNEPRLLLSDNIKKKRQIESRQSTGEKFQLEVLRTIEWEAHRGENVERN